jgi:hypothetical protein
VPLCAPSPWLRFVTLRKRRNKARGKAHGKKLAGRKYASRSLLVLERSSFTSQKYLSDIAGQDTRAHGDSPRVLARLVRAWLSQESKRKGIPGDRRIFAAYESFSLELPALCDAAGLDYDELSYPDLLGLAQQWLQERSNY